MIDGDAFASLIAPVSAETFFADFFERDALHVARGDADYFAWLYDVGAVEDALALGADAPEHFSLVKHGESEITPAQLTSERNAPPDGTGRKPARYFALDPRNVFAAFADGFTLNIKDAGAFDPRLAQLCNRIQTHVGFYAQANVYFTPAGAQGFDIHYDTHDTLIAHIEGTKSWAIYEPVVPLPLEIQPFSKSRHEGRLGPPRIVRLEAGDSLYIPRGFPHHATSGEQRALHLTFALSPVRVADLLDAVVRLATLGDVELRRALPPGWQHDPAFAARFSERLAQLLPRAIVPERIPPAAELAYNDLFAAGRTVAAGTFDALAALESLASESRLTLRGDALYQVRDRGERLDLGLATTVIAVPASARAAIQRLIEGPATFGELARLMEADSARALVRTLVIEGLLLVDASFE